MPQFFDQQAIPRSLDSIYNAYLAQQKQKRQAGVDFASYGFDPSILGDPNTQKMVQGPENSVELPSIKLARDFIARKKQAQGLGTRKTESDIAYTQSRTSVNDAIARSGGKAPPGYRFSANGDLERIPGGPADQKSVEKNTALDTTFQLYETARDGLLSGLEGSETGYFAGRLPAITSAQQTAQGGVAAMSPVLKQMFRAAGEGVFTDRDQALLLEMIPTRTTLPEARAAQIQNIDNIVKAKLGRAQRGAAQGGGQAPAPRAGGDAKSLVRQLAAQGMGRDQIKAELKKRGF